MRRSSLLRFVFVLLTIVAAGSFSAPGAVPNRIQAAVSDGQRVAQANSVSPRVRSAVDQGRLNGATALTALSINFLPSAAQQAALDALLQAQQDSRSPSYHKWLTPAQFGAQFGMSDSDLAAVTAWLQTHGLQVTDVAPSRNAIHFSGTVAQVEQAFQTELHALSVNGEAHFANTTAPMLPIAFAGTVGSVRGLDNFRPKPYAHAATATVPYRVGTRTSSFSAHPFSIDPNTGTEYVAPEDFAKIYDVNTLYNAGFTGSASYPIGIIGQTAVDSTDISAFRSAFGLSLTLPTYVLMPGTGQSTVIDSGDLSESELDLEWAGAVAKDAPLYFIYTGNAGCTSNQGCTFDVFSALQYAIQSYPNPPTGKLLPILSLSYGSCEPQEAQFYATYESWFQQANAQGQTILTASGDQGAAGCDYTTTAANNYAAVSGLHVSYPASSAYVTGIGGTSFSGDLTSSFTYWAPADDANLGNELGLFIPSATWNDTPTLASLIAQEAPGVTPSLSASGGGVSALFSKPSWQIGPGVPADGKRDVPDLSLSADPNHDGFLVCINGSCTPTTQNPQPYFNVYGGTSVASPSFAGILAITEQKLANFQGNINPLIYRIGTNATAYASAFHDITTGNNAVPCVVTASDTGCTGGSGGYSTMGYSAGVGYDLVTGLGAIDAANFAVALGGVANVNATTNTLTFSPTGPATGQTVTFTANIGTGGLTPAATGSVVFTVDAAATGTSVAVGTTGVATFTTTFTLGGPHTVAAVYSGDANYYGSSSIATVPVTALGTVPTTTTLAVSPSTVAVGSSLTLTATVSTTGAGTLAGSVTFTAGTGSGATQIGPIVGVPLTVSGAAGTAVLAYTVAAAALPVGTDTITANFGGGGAFASSSGTATVTVTSPSITLSATSFSVASGGSGSSTVTVTSGGNYSGTVSLSASTTSTLSGNPAFVPPTIILTAGAKGTSTFTLSSATASAVPGKGTLPLRKTLSSIATVSGLSFASLLLFGFRTRGITGRKGWVSLLTVLVFAVLALGLGCSGSSSTSTTTPTTGTFTVTITATDTNNSTIAGSTNITVTVTN